MDFISSVRSDVSYCGKVNSLLKYVFIVKSHGMTSMITEASQVWLDDNHNTPVLKSSFVWHILSKGKNKQNVHF